MIVDRLVHKVPSLVVRFRCPRCAKRFTDLPPFAYPEKRYTVSQILERSERYTEDNGATYRSTVRQDGLETFHAHEASGQCDDRTLSHSSVWRWISSLSGLVKTLCEALEMIRSHSPSCDLFRRALLAAPRKYRSEPRRRRLETVRLLLHTEWEYRASFEGSIFPGLATASGFV